MPISFNFRNYFKWKLNYEVIALNEHSEPNIELLWGFCQLCRLIQMKKRPNFIIKDLRSFWDNTCENSGDFVNNFLNNTQNSAKQIS